MLLSYLINQDNRIFLNHDKRDKLREQRKVRNVIFDFDVIYKIDFEVFFKTSRAIKATGREGGSKVKVTGC